jgi:RHS repeat-associated protein
LIDFAGAIAELYAFDAYGNAIGFDPSVALTEFLYSGEQFDSKIGQQYLRQRYYDPATGRFNRLDPFFGNLTDPQSLHKYLYCQANPLNLFDPTGMFGVGGFGVGMAIAGNISSMKNSADMSTLDSVRLTISGIQAGLNPTQIFATIILNEITGVITGFVGGKLIVGTKAILQDGITIKMPSFQKKGFNVVAIQKGASTKPLQRDANLTNATNIPGANGNRAPFASHFSDPVQIKRAQEWDDFVNAHSSITDVRINQRQIDVDGVYSGMNRPDIQITLNPGNYKLPNGIEINVPYGSTKRIYIEFDNRPFTRVDDHFSRTHNNDPSSIQILELNDQNGMVGSLFFY